MNLLLPEIHILQEHFRERNLELLCFRFHQQERGFSGAELYVLNDANFVVTVENCATDQVANVSPTWFQSGSLLSGNLQIAMQQSFRIRDRIKTGELKNQITFVRPKFLDLNFAPRAIFRQGPQLHAIAEAVCNIGVQLHRNFAAASLRLADAGQGNKLAGYSRISNA